MNLSSLRSKHESGEHRQLNGETTVIWLFLATFKSLIRIVNYFCLPDLVAFFWVRLTSKSGNRSIQH